MAEKNQDKRLRKGFFDENLSKKEKEEFLKRASTDKDFVKDFVKDLEEKVENQADSCDEEAEEDVSDESLDP